MITSQSSQNKATSSLNRPPAFCFFSGTPKFPYLCFEDSVIFTTCYRSLCSSRMYKSCRAGPERPNKTILGGGGGANGRLSWSMAHVLNKARRLNLAYWLPVPTQNPLSTAHSRPRLAAISLPCQPIRLLWAVKACNRVDFCLTQVALRGNMTDAAHDEY